MTTARSLSTLVIMRSFLFVSSSIAASFLYVKLDFSFFCWLFHQCIDMICHKVYTCWFTVAIQVSSLKWTRSLLNRKKFCKSEDNWFLLYLFEIGMKLRFLFRSLYIWKENECFDKVTTFSDGSDLYLSAFVLFR